MHRGYVKVWRKIEDNGWLRNHKVCAFWLWCLMKASHKECSTLVGCQNIHLQPGDFVFGRKAASSELGMSEQSIRTILKYLKNSGNLTIKSTNKFSIISIVNWGIYQQQEATNNQQPNKPLTSYQPATNHKQECKELKNNNNTPTVDEIISYCQDRKNNVNAQAFYDFYSSKGWMIGKNRMKDWKAAIRTWERTSLAKDNKATW